MTPSAVPQIPPVVPKEALVAWKPSKLEEKVDPPATTVIIPLVASTL